MNKTFATLSFVAAILAAAVTRADLVHYYSFDSQTARDSVGDSDGTINGDPTFATGATGDAADFAIELNQDGLGSHDDYVSFEPEEFGDYFTISAWIQPNGEQDHQMMAIAANTHGGFAGPDGFKWTVQQWDVYDESLRLETGDTVTGTNNGTTGVILEEEWQHVAIAFDKDVLQYEMFYNGFSLGTGTILDFGDEHPWQIGAFRAPDGGAPNAGFIGLIDAVAVFDEALTEDDILDIFENGIDVPDVSIPGDFDENGVLDIADINLLLPQVASGQDFLAFDLNNDMAVDGTDVGVWANDLYGTWMGDANLDGEFNSGDLVQIFQRGKYDLDEDALWDEGDWTGDLRFNSSDLVAAFQNGGFEQGPLPAALAVPEPTSAFTLVLLGWIGMTLARRRR